VGGKNEEKAIRGTLFRALAVATLVVAAVMVARGEGLFLVAFSSGLVLLFLYIVLHVPSRRKTTQKEKAESVHRALGVGTPPDFSPEEERSGADEEDEHHPP
jgi:hypothetical protein